MEIINPAWKQQKKRQLTMLAFGVLSVHTVGIQKLDINLIGIVKDAITDDHAAGNTSYTEAVLINERGQAMLRDLSPYDVIDPDWAMERAREKGGSVLLGEQISVTDAMRYNYAAGFRGQDLIRKTAIDGKESNYHPGAIGDVNWNANGDRSVGTGQIYCSPNGSVGCDGIRYWKANFDPLINAQHSYVLYVEAWNLWGYDERFRPWQNNQAGIEAMMEGARQAYAELESVYGNLD